MTEPKIDKKRVHSSPRTVTCDLTSKARNSAKYTQHVQVNPGRLQTSEADSFSGQDRSEKKSIKPI